MMGHVLLTYNVMMTDTPKVSLERRACRIPKAEVMLRRRDKHRVGLQSVECHPLDLGG